MKAFLRGISVRRLQRALLLATSGRICGVSDRPVCGDF